VCIVEEKGKEERIKMVVAFSGMALSTGAYAVSADVTTGTYQYVGKGVLTLVAKSSATGLNATVKVNGVPIMDDQPIPWFGTTGTMTIRDNIVFQQGVSGGRVECRFRNTSSGALTVDYMMLFDISGR